MSIIDGVPDEYTLIVIGLILVVIAYFGWRTTIVEPEVHVRTVYFFDPETRTNRHFARLTSRVEAHTVAPSFTPEEVSPSGSSNSSSTEEVEDIIRTMDSPSTDDEASELRRRRLAHFENANNESTVNTAHDHSNVQDCATTRAPIDTGLAEIGDGEAAKPRESEGTEIPLNQQANSSSSITIKLKYLNDDMKIVNGTLDEKLGDFKQRNFTVELAANKLVRLIFNGQVLQGDTQTLQSYGMFDNCVVHCLVQQQPRHPQSRRITDSGSNGRRYQRDWDLSNFLIAGLSFALGAAWYFRYQCPHLFTISTTVGLIALTGMFSVISMSMYFPELIMRVQVTTTTTRATSTETPTIAHVFRERIRNRFWNGRRHHAT